MSHALLPNGLGDLLAPQAEFEAKLIADFMATFAGFSYARVKPPLVEFEESLLAEGPGQALSRNTFRLMDPVSQRMMGVRADATAQIARIAGSRLAKEKRPLRLSYVADVLRVKATQLRPERQFCQVGCELIGAATLRDDVEVMLVALLALDKSGIGNISLDLTVPTLVAHIYAELESDAGVQEAINAHLEKRDHDAIAAIGDPAADMIARIMEMTGAAEDVLPMLAGFSLPGKAGADLSLLGNAARELREALDTYELDKVAITIDPLETRGFEYQTGISFTLFAKGVRGEMGRGGRYNAGSEQATGFTFYMDTILRAAPMPAAPDCQAVPADSSWKDVKDAQKAGPVRRG